MFEQRPQTDLEDVETTLLQVMSDEFEVNVEDDTAYQVAQVIMNIRTTTQGGDFSLVNKLHSEWVAKSGKPAAIFKEVERSVDEDNTDEDGVDLEDSTGDEDGDVEMGDDPAETDPPKIRQNPGPEVDEDGFTKVVSRKKR
jgi:pre-rRNA-processing protein TSR2